MSPAALRAAIEEAERFLKAAKAARATINKDGGRESLEGGRLTAAATRASLDLTRALAEMRSRT